MEEILQDLPESEDVDLTRSLYFINANKVNLCGKKYALIWTKHALMRAKERFEEESKCVDAVEFILGNINEKDPSLLSADRDGAGEDESLASRDIAIRSFPGNLMFVMNIDDAKRTALIKTIGGLDLYPHNGDYCITYYDGGKVGSRVWHHQ